MQTYQTFYAVFEKVSKRINYYIKILKILFSGTPLIVKRPGKVFKVTLNIAAKKQLDREILNSKSALQWDIYSNEVVVLKRIVPFAAKSVLIEEEQRDKTRKDIFILKQDKMIEICKENLEYTLRAPRGSARKVLNSQIHSLDLDLKIDQIGYSQFSELFCSNFFEYQIPVTPMHGDFSPFNALIRDEKLYLIDWEYALSEGSILYDWWSLNSKIGTQKMLNKNTEIFFFFLQSALEKMDLCFDKFNAFGLAMYSLMYLSRFGIRDDIDEKRMNKIYSGLNTIVSKLN